MSPTLDTRAVSRPNPTKGFRLMFHIDARHKVG